MIKQGKTSSTEESQSVAADTANATLDTAGFARGFQPFQTSFPSPVNRRGETGAGIV
jgi:hypothetical protein